jgi:hypothetical protein
LIAPSVLR